MSYLKNPFIKLSLILPLLYWIYLAFASSMNIRFDAEGFERLGGVLNQEGWIGFFKNSPDQSPFYPFIISLSMRIADILLISYQKVQTVVQIIIFLISQLLLLKILKDLRIHENITAGILFYFGFSPALVNTVFSLFSEIATYPFVLLLVLITVAVWQKVLRNENPFIIIFYSILLGINFFILTCTRAIYEYILIFYILSFSLVSLKFLTQKQFIQFIKTLGFLLIIFVSFQALLNQYKMLNLKYNQNKVTVRIGSPAVYVTSAGRTRDLTKEQFLMAIAHIPGEGVCQKIYGKEKCSFWYKGMHKLGLNRAAELMQSDIPQEQHNSILLKEAKELIFKKPFQYTLLNIMEATKMFFWESTMIGYVFYPDWLSKLFNKAIIKNPIRLGVSLITIYCFFNCLFTFFQRGNLFETTSNHSIYLFTILIIVGWNIILHSFFITHPRYALPFASLYLILIASTLQRVFVKN